MIIGLFIAIPIILAVCKYLTFPSDETASEVAQVIVIPWYWMFVEFIANNFQNHPIIFLLSFGGLILVLKYLKEI